MSPNSQNLVILDVRSPMEFATGHVDGALNLPLDSFLERYPSALPSKAQTIVAYCASGARSGQVVQFLRQQGYTDVVNGVSASNVAGQLQKAIVR
jgi:phage shock protein E